MKFRLLYLTLISLLPFIGSAQTPVPTTTYTLHAQKERRSGFSLMPTIVLPPSVLAITAENGLLVLIPQADGKWVLKHLAGWSTQAPTERTLDIVGVPNEGSDVSIGTDLTVSPNGNYVITRINYSHGAIGPNDRNRKTVVTVVDLHMFTIVSRQVTTDPLLADSEWRFDERGDLLTRGLIKPSLAGWVVGAAVLSLPSLNPTTRCQYEAVSEFHLGRRDWTRPVDKEISDECAALLKAAHVASLEDLLGNSPYTDDVIKFQSRGCQIKDVNQEIKIASLECRMGRSYADGEIFFTSSHVLRILSLPTGRETLSLQLPHNFHEMPGLLRAVSGQNYLILLRDGIYVEVYRLSHQGALMP